MRLTFPLTLSVTLSLRLLFIMFLFNIVDESIDFFTVLYKLSSFFQFWLYQNAQNLQQTKYALLRLSKLKQKTKNQRWAKLNKTLLRNLHGTQNKCSVSVLFVLVCVCVVWNLSFLRSCVNFATLFFFVFSVFKN